MSESGMFSCHYARRCFPFHSLLRLWFTVRADSSSGQPYFSVFFFFSFISFIDASLRRLSRSLTEPHSLPFHLIDLYASDFFFSCLMFWKRPFFFALSAASFKM